MSGKPAKVNKQYAATCYTCKCSKSTVYSVDHSDECNLNIFLGKVGELRLKRLDIDAQMQRLLLTDHALPLHELRWHIKNGCGFVHAVYAPEWVVEGINMYYSSQFADLSLGDFLQSLNPG